MTTKDFKEIWDQKREILAANPDKCVVKVKADSRLVNGFMSRVKARDFDIVVDQNKGMGGTDQGPRPSEYVLAALAACHEVTYRLYADALGIHLDEVSVSVTGHSDARGFSGWTIRFVLGFHTLPGKSKFRPQPVIRSWNVSGRRLISTAPFSTICEIRYLLN